MIADVIRDTGADVVTLSETGQAYSAKLVTDLARRGYRFHVYGPDKDVGVVSRYPILETASFDRFSKAVIDVHGTPVAVYSGHLEYRWYVCYLPRGYGGGTPSGNPTSEYDWNKIPGGPITDVPLILDLNEKSGRPESIRQFVADAASERAKGRIVVMAGDFNEPSHLDWTSATRNLYDHRGSVVPWQSTLLLEQAGYRDAYRTRFPDPTTHPGFTWPSDNSLVPTSRLTWAPDSDERDRIDYVFYQPDDRLALTDALVVGPRQSILRNQRVAESSQDPILEPLGHWPTDHKTVMATFTISPLALTPQAPPAVRLDRTYSQPLTVTGGSAPLVFRLVAGSLPPGVSLSQSGVLQGAPTAAGRYDFTVAVQDAQGLTATQAYTLQVEEIPENEKAPGHLQLSSSPNPSRPGDAVTLTAQVSAGGSRSAQSRAPLFPSGNVVFSDNGVVLGTAPLVQGRAQWTVTSLAAGTHAMEASYAGDARVSVARMTATHEVSAAPMAPPAPVPVANAWLLALLGGILLGVSQRRLGA